MFDSSIFVKKIWVLKKWCVTKVAHCISRFCPFLEIQNFELHFLLGGGGGGAGDQKNKYVLRYDEIMIFFFYVFGSFLSIWGFLRSTFRFGKCFWGR